MKLKREPIDVDLYVENKPLTEKDRKEIVEFLETYKKKQRPRIRRSVTHKKAKVTR